MAKKERLVSLSGTSGQKLPEQLQEASAAASLHRQSNHRGPALAAAARQEVKAEAVSAEAVSAAASSRQSCPSWTLPGAPSKHTSFQEQDHVRLLQSQQ
ncbi:TPA: hypothetical protein ACH3X2_009020 [Trebouxia sp. C0005]